MAATEDRTGTAPKDNISGSEISGSVFHLDQDQRGHVNVAFSLDPEPEEPGPRIKPPLARRLSSMLPEELPKVKPRHRIVRYSASHLRQNYQPAQQAAVKQYSSIDYYPSNNKVYREWLRKKQSKAKPSRERHWQVDRWFIVTVIGVITGALTMILKQSIQGLTKAKLDQMRVYQQEDRIVTAWGWTAGISCLYVIAGSVLVVYAHPPAVGGGAPDFIAFLNGISVHGVLSLRNLLVKLASTALCVASGLPLATQGPVIVIGGIVGTGVSQMMSRMLHCRIPIFKHFRNTKDRMMFTTIGMAAGLAAGFNSPIAGIFFSFEDQASNWTRRLSVMVFYSSVVSVLTATLLNSQINHFKFIGSYFGSITIVPAIPIWPHVILVPIAIILGLCGGFLAAIFTHANAKMCANRKQFLAKIKKIHLKNFVRILEPAFLAVVMASYTVALPQGFRCSTYEQGPPIVRFYKNSEIITQPCLGVPLEGANCPAPENDTQPGGSQYNQLASLLQAGGTDVLDRLWSRGTLSVYPGSQLMAAFAIWFPVIIWTVGTAVAGGIFAPLLISGALLGRSLGIAMNQIWEKVAGTPFPLNTPFDCLDPGCIALIGSAAVFSGVSRLSVGTALIVLEMCGDYNMVIPVIISSLVAKNFADTLSKPFTRVLVDGKALPLLDAEPDVVIGDRLFSLDIFRAADVMSVIPLTVHPRESVARLATLLLTAPHQGFPVVQWDPVTKVELYYGFITRYEIQRLLLSRELQDETLMGSVICPNVPYKELAIDQTHLRTPPEKQDLLKTMSETPLYVDVWLDMVPYINTSAMTVEEDFSLKRTFEIFRYMALRALTVVSLRHEVVGIITRKDLLPFHIQQRTAQLPRATGRHQDHPDPWANGGVSGVRDPQEPGLGDSKPEVYIIDQQEGGSRQPDAYIDSQPGTSGTSSEDPKVRQRSKASSGSLGTNNARRASFPGRENRGANPGSGSSRRPSDTTSESRSRTSLSSWSSSSASDGATTGGIQTDQSRILQLLNPNLFPVSGPAADNPSQDAGRSQEPGTDHGDPGYANPAFLDTTSLNEVFYEEI